MTRLLRIVRGCLCLVWLFVNGCAPSLAMLKLREPDIAVPENFGMKENDASHDPEFSENLNWKMFFKDEKLVGLISAGMSKNRELAIVEQEVKVAQNEIMAREGEYIPKLGIRGGAGFEKVGKLTSQGQSDEANGVAERLGNFNLGFAASWEIDVWGKLRNATKAALYRYYATVDGRNYMITRLVAEIANAYYELRALNAKTSILGENIQLQQQALDMIRLQKRAARVTELAVKRFEAEVLKNQSRRYLLRQAITEKENELNFLAGQFPRHIEEEATSFISLIPRGIHAGVPVKMLKNRPDVRAAENELQASKLSVDSARARFYPSLSIEAGVGFQAFNTQHLLTSPESLFYNLGANLTAPLLNRQGIKADYLSAGSKQLQAVYHFEKTILNAYTEVVNQLNKVENLKNTFKLKSEQVVTLNDSVDISNTLFRAARCDYMEVLLTRRDALEAQMELVEVKQQQLSAAVNLYKALGGGWKQEEIVKH